MVSDSDLRCPPSSIRPLTVPRDKTSRPDNRLFRLTSADLGVDATCPQHCRDEKISPSVEFPSARRHRDTQPALQDTYNLFCDLNGLLHQRGLQRLEDLLRPAAMSGIVSNVVTASLAKHSWSLTANRNLYGDPELVVAGAATTSLRALVRTRGTTQQPSRPLQDYVMMVFRGPVRISERPARNSRVVCGSPALAI